MQWLETKGSMNYYSVVISVTFRTSYSPHLKNSITTEHGFSNSLGNLDEITVWRYLVDIMHTFFAIIAKNHSLFSSGVRGLYSLGADLSLNFD